MIFLSQYISINFLCCFVSILTNSQKKERADFSSFSLPFILLFILLLLILLCLLFSARGLLLFSARGSCCFRQELLLLSARDMRLFSYLVWSISIVIYHFFWSEDIHLDMFELFMPKCSEKKALDARQYHFSAHNDEIETKSNFSLSLRSLS